MTYQAALTASVLRSLLVVAAGLCVAELLAAWVGQARTGRSRWWRCVLIALPFLTPNLVVGYGYRGLSLNLLRWPWVNESIYFLLICFELVPAAVWMLRNAGRPAISAEGVSLARLARQQPASPLRAWWTWFQLWRRGPVSQRFAPAALLFVLSFQEAELAALMQVHSWTERIFTDHTRGLPAIATMGLVLWPVLIQAAALWPLLRFLGEIRGVSEGASRVSAAGSGWRLRSRGAIRWFAVVWVLAAIGAVIALPLQHMLASARVSMRTLFLQPMWFRELGDSLLVAVTCGGLAWMLAAAVCGRPQPVGIRTWTKGLWGAVLLASLVPGLMGTLAVGLLTSAGFQHFLPRWAYTPWPLVLAELAWLWPRAVIVWQTLETRTRLVNHQSRLLSASPQALQRRQGRRLWWRLRGQELVGGAILVGWWSYLEVMLPTLLSPPGFQPAPMVLYNHLHYGQIAALGVKLVMILGAPLMLLGIPWGIWSLAGRRLPK